MSTIFVLCRPSYKKKLCLGRFFKISFFRIRHPQCSMLEFLSNDVTLTQLPESMKAVALSASVLLYSLIQNRWIWANLSNRGSCTSLLHPLFILRSTSFPNIDLINKRHAMYISRRTRSRISHIHCVSEPSIQYLRAPAGASVDPSVP